MTVALERLKRPKLSLQKETSQLNYLFFEAEYQSFLNWWQSNQNRFDNLSFRVDNQINLFFDQLGKRGFHNSFSQLRADLYGYYLEYIKQEGIIPFTLKIQDNGRIFGEFYGGKDIEEMIDEREREGVLKTAMKDLKSKLRDLKQGEIIFRISPSGWTGFDYQYLETQAQIFWRDELASDKIRGLTIRTQIDLEKILSFLNDLGLSVPEVINEEKELIKWVTSLNLPLPYSFDRFLPVVINAFQNRDHLERDLRKQIEEWQRQDSNFYYFDQIASLVGFIENKLRELVIKGYSQEDIREEMRSLLGFILMAMTASSIRENLSFENISFKSSDSQLLPTIFYDRVFNHLLSLPGCAGGGNLFNNFVMSTFGSINVGEEKLISEMKCVTCPFCGKTVDAQIISSGSKKYIRCPECKSEVEKND